MATNAFNVDTIKDMVKNGATNKDIIEYIHKECKSIIKEHRGIGWYEEFLSTLLNLMEKMDFSGVNDIHLFKTELLADYETSDILEFTVEPFESLIACGDTNMERIIGMHDEIVKVLNYFNHQDVLEYDEGILFSPEEFYYRMNDDMESLLNNIDKVINDYMLLDEINGIKLFKF